jgi:hypothetical protein
MPAYRRPPRATRSTFTPSTLRGHPQTPRQARDGLRARFFHGFPGTVVAGSGRYLGATGRVTFNKEGGEGSDIVAKIRLTG